MFNNYLKIAWRNLIKSRFYAAINIVGLTVGLTVGILILIWIQDELSYNRFPQSSTIYRVNSKVDLGTEVAVWATSPAPVAAFGQQLTGIKKAVRFRSNWNYTLFTYKKSEFKAENMSYTDPALFDMLGVKWIAGNRKNPFPDDQSVVITQSTATKYFGKQNPIGKVIQGDHTDNFMVRGVVEDFPENADIRADIFFPMSIRAKNYDGKGFWKSMDSDWGNFNYITLVQLKEGISPENIAAQLSAINKKNDPNAKRSRVDQAYVLQDITQLNLYNPDGSASGIQTVRIFFVSVVIILLIAGINYVNLSTARSMLRAKEVSIRKIIGAKKSQLFIQFIIESVLFFAISLIFAFGFIYLLMPYFNELSGKHIQFDLFNSAIWKVILITISSTLVLSAVYPALLLSSFKPILALKGKIISGMGSSAFRQVLVTVQFVFSVALIIGTLVIARQLSHIRSINPGYSREQVFKFGMRAEMIKHIQSVKNELRRQPGIVNVSVADANLVNIGNTTGDSEWDGKDPNEAMNVHPLRIDESFIPMMKIKLAEGRNFDGQAADSAHFILNEAAVKAMDIKDPIGKRFKLGQEGTIIGVAKDFNVASMKTKVEPTVIMYWPTSWMMYVKTTGKDAKKAIAAVEKMWAKYGQGYPFDYAFLDDDYDKMYRADQRIGTLFTLFSSIAILLSCLGLFGLATYTSQVRIKEIGIRKVLGASVIQITSLLSWNFLRLVLVAILIASPVAWWAMNLWLADFAYKISISWWMFALAGGSALLIAFFTISFQAVKAALANPVRSLRSE